MPNWQRGMMRAMRIPNHTVTVHSIHDFTDWYRRITFSAPEFVQGLELSPTLWLRLWVPDLERGEDFLHQRGYTFVDVRPDQGTFGLDFVLHEVDGPAGNWARDAEIGQQREVAMTPRPVTLPEGTTGLLLAGDVTALPAINTWIESTAAEVRIEVLLEDEHTDRENLPQASHPNLSWSWVAPEAGYRGSALASRLREYRQPGAHKQPGLYAWAAGEKGLVKTLRPVLRDHLGLDRSQHFSQFYWIEGKKFG